MSVCFLQTMGSYDSALWFGLHQPTPNDPFTWVDKTSLSYTNWGCGEPNNWAGLEDCGILGMGDRNDNSNLWNDDTCSKTFNYICQKQIHGASPCTVGWEYNAQTDSCFYFASEKKVSFQAARTACKLAVSGADIAEIYDQQEQWFVTDQLKKLNLTSGQKLWIGLTDMDKDKVYNWTSGPWNMYSNWDCSSKWQDSCTYIDSQPSKVGIWDVAACSAGNGYICRWSPTPKASE